MAAAWTTLDAAGDATAVVAKPAGKFASELSGCLRLVRGIEIIDACRHHRDVDDTFQTFIERCADDDVGVWVGLFANAGGSFRRPRTTSDPCRR